MYQKYILACFLLLLFLSVLSKTRVLKDDKVQKNKAALHHNQHESRRKLNENLHKDNALDYDEEGIGDEEEEEYDDDDSYDDITGRKKVMRWKMTTKKM